MSKIKIKSAFLKKNVIPERIEYVRSFSGGYWEIDFSILTVELLTGLGAKKVDSKMYFCTTAAVFYFIERMPSLARHNDCPCNSVM